MQLYIYCQSGHNFGLENLRRCSAIYKELEHLNPILATADYRAATFAKEQLNVKTGLGVDVIGNLPHMMQRMDILIFDSKEPSDTMREYMNDYCTHLYEVGVDIPYDIVNDIYFSKDKIETKREKCLFFADDDYANEMLELCKDSKKQDIPLLLGHYFFLGNDEKLAPYFSEIIEDEDYVQTIKETKFLLTSSVNSCLESLASGNSPVYYQRIIKEDKGNLDLIEKYNIPTIGGENLEQLVEEFDKLIENYPKTVDIEKIDIGKIKQEIETTLKKYEGLF